MQFPTLEFLLFFVLIFLGASYLRRYINTYKYYLLGVSIIFYLSWSWYFLTIMFADTVVSYFLMRLVARYRSKLFLVLGLIVNFGIWGFFKYYNFFIDSLFNLTHALGLQLDITVLEILAPIGISFFTFRLVSHLVDAYRGKYRIVPSFIDYANYITFFPQITSGPIALAPDFYQDLNTREFNYDPARVILLILLGLFKKYVLASYLFDYVQSAFAAPCDYSSLDLVIGAFAYSALLYVDFSGYTDLSTAIANLLGFRVPANFLMPYMSVNLQEFWRRWHTTLGNWLKWYIYIPLGGNRGGLTKKYRNLILTMTFAGLWHGAGWNYVIWGFLHGVGLCVNQLFNIAFNKRFHRLPEIFQWLGQPIVTVISWAITLNFVVFTRVIFNTPSLEVAGEYFNRIFNPLTTTDVLASNSRLLGIMLLVLALNFVEIPLLNGLTKLLRSLPGGIWLIIVVSICYVLLSLGPETVAPFIYYRF